MTRHWQVELHQARRRVRVLEYLLERAKRPHPERVEARVTIMDQVEDLIKQNDMQTFRQIVERAAGLGIAENSVTHALKSLAESGRASVDRRGGKWSLIAYGFIIALCLCSSAATAQTGLLALPNRAATIAKPVYSGNRLTLTWTASPSTNVLGYRLYYGTNYNQRNFAATVGNVTNATIDRLTSGVDYFLHVTAYDTSGESLPSNVVTNFIFPPLRIEPHTYAFTASAPNRTNLWQVSTNGMTWTTRATVVTNVGAPLLLVLSNNLPQQFVRLR